MVAFNKLDFDFQTPSAVHLERLQGEPYVGCWSHTFVQRCVRLSVGPSATGPSGSAFCPADRRQMDTMRLCAGYLFVYFWFCFGLPPSLRPSRMVEWLLVFLLQTP